MITKLMSQSNDMPKIRKTVDNCDRSLYGAFEYGKRLTFDVEAPRVLGASAVVLRICSDDTGEEMDIPLSFVSSGNGVDIYRVEIDLAKLCGNELSGLFYYEILFLRGWDTLFTNTTNNVDFTLSTKSENRFRLLVYEKGFKTPKWFSGGTMYHVFVDRFCRGEGEYELRDDSVLNEDWENGIPQYPKKGGDRFTNNVFFGGNLWGVAEKLPYLRSLGVTVIYLSPIFKAYSNHKYDTGNYLEVDKMFGGDAAFENLLKVAKKHKIKIILDGVFNHTGDDSLYFDKYGKYGKTGAYSNPNSPFHNWFCFKRYPEEYESWWGIDILPKLNLNNPECREYLAGKGGVAEKYAKMGIGGWRLDVADELPNEFLDELRQSVKEVSGDDAIIIGEVWENAADKMAYGRRRRYFRGRQLDSVMNYPFRNGVIAYVKNGNAKMFADILTEIYSSYPEGVCNCLMNILGTHDTERILTLLGQSEEDKILDSSRSNDELAVRRLDVWKYALAKKRLMVAAALQFTVYGIPSVFYGDEAGLEGYHDPFCRMPYPWGHEDKELIRYYKKLGEIRKENSVFSDGSFKILCVRDSLIAFERRKGKERVIVISNMGDNAEEFFAEGKDLLTNEKYSGVIGPCEVRIIKQAVKITEA